MLCYKNVFFFLFLDSYAAFLRVKTFVFKEEPAENNKYKPTSSITSSIYILAVVPNFADKTIDQSNQHEPAPDF